MAEGTVVRKILIPHTWVPKLKEHLVRKGGMTVEANGKYWAGQLSSSHARTTALMNPSLQSLPTEEPKRQSTYSHCQGPHDS